MRTFTSESISDTIDIITQLFPNDISEVTDIVYDVWYRVYQEGRPLVLCDNSIRARAARYSNAYSYGDLLLVLETFVRDAMRSYDVQEQMCYSLDDENGIENDYQDFLYEMGLSIDNDDYGDYVGTLTEYCGIDSIASMLAEQYTIDYGRILTDEQESELYTLVDDLAPAYVI